MFKKLINIFAVLLFALSIIACSSGSKKQSRGGVSDPVEEYNTKLKQFRYPDGTSRPGFTYKKADVQADFDAWAEKNAGTIKEALAKIPADYLLEIKGHTDSIGPETAEGKKLGNVHYSEIRAKAVKDALVKKGIDANRMITKGAGSSSPLEGIESKDPKNRRVTFSFVKKAEEAKQESSEAKENKETEEKPQNE